MSDFWDAKYGAPQSSVSPTATLLADVGGAVGRPTMQAVVAAGLPAQADNAGKVLGTDGTTIVWTTPAAVPSSVFTADVTIDLKTPATTTVYVVPSGFQDVDADWEVITDQNPSPGTAAYLSFGHDLAPAAFVPEFQIPSDKQVANGVHQIQAPTDLLTAGTVVTVTVTRASTATGVNTATIRVTIKRKAQPS